MDQMPLVQHLAFSKYSCNSGTDIGVLKYKMKAELGLFEKSFMEVGIILQLVIHLLITVYIPQTL